MKEKFLFIFFTSDFYKFYYSLNTVATIKASEKDAIVFFSGYSCNFLRINWQDEKVKKVHNKIIENGMEDYKSLLNLCKDLNIKFYYCSTAFSFLNIKSDDIFPDLNINSEGLYSIINSYKTYQIIFI